MVFPHQPPTISSPSVWGSANIWCFFPPQKVMSFLEVICPRSDWQYGMPPMPSLKEDPPYLPPSVVHSCHSCMTRAKLFLALPKSAPHISAWSEYGQLLMDAVFGLMAVIIFVCSGGNILNLSVGCGRSWSHFAENQQHRREMFFLLCHQVRQRLGSKIGHGLTMPRCW